MTHRQPEIIEIVHAGEAVRLEWPADADLIEPLVRGELSIVAARELVDERRREEAIERKRLAHEKHLADCREAWESEFGR